QHPDSGHRGPGQQALPQRLGAALGAALGARALAAAPALPGLAGALRRALAATRPALALGRLAARPAGGAAGGTQDWHPITAATLGGRYLQAGLPGSHAECLAERAAPGQRAFMRRSLD